MQRRVPKESTTRQHTFSGSPLGVEPVLPNWKVGVVTASPPSRTFI